MTDFKDHSEALGRLKDELELLKAGNEIIAEHEQTAKSALDTSHRLATTNQELAERITLVADQLEHTATTVEGQFSTLQTAAATTAQTYQSLLTDLSQLDVVAKMTATESRLGEIQQILIDKVLEIVGLLGEQATTTAELQQAQNQLLSLTSPLHEQLTNQERAIASAELKAGERAALIEERLDALSLAIVSPLQDQLNALQQTIADVELKTGERFTTLDSTTNNLRQSLEAQIADQREDINRLTGRLAETHRAQSELRQQLESVRKSAKNSSSYAIVSLIAQVGLLVLFALLLLFVVLQRAPA